MKNRMTTHLVVAELCANFRAWVVVALCGLELGKDHIALHDLVVRHDEIERLQSHVQWTWGKTYELDSCAGSAEALTYQESPAPLLR